MKNNRQENLTVFTSDSRPYIALARQGRQGQDIQIVPVFDRYLLNRSGIVGTGNTLEQIYIYFPSLTGQVDIERLTRIPKVQR